MEHLHPLAAAAAVVVACCRRDARAQSVPSPPAPPPPPKAPLPSIGVVPCGYRRRRLVGLPRLEAPPHRPLRGALPVRIRLRLQEPLPELHQVSSGDG
ncbi:Os07g0100300 [Oryza sativa Japonica Group]|uniref:Os07g0100300 protein n=1 Tax=Oryza sativa subsp. japonica TaxID=39947 RepID=C7J520_ORYSJ|nr:Os07g0100300 [Oryza sativa Japonica Group]|eukprot:NP_001175013.1 Os07g0100300 [Oryza sativa Japonica Group]